MVTMFKVHAVACGEVEPDHTVNCESWSEALAARSEHTGYGFTIVVEPVDAAEIAQRQDAALGYSEEAEAEMDALCERLYDAHVAHL